MTKKEYLRELTQMEKTISKHPDFNIEKRIIDLHEIIISKRIIEEKIKIKKKDRHQIINNLKYRIETLYD